MLLNRLTFVVEDGGIPFDPTKKATMAKGGSISLKGVSPSVKQVFTITGFNSLFVFYKGYLPFIGEVKSRIQRFRHTLHR